MTGKVLSRKEIKAAFVHAKSHITEAIAEAIREDHHAIMEVDGVVRRDIQAMTERFMDAFLKRAKKTTLMNFMGDINIG